MSSILRNLISLLVFWLAAIAATSALFAQGLLVDVRPGEHFRLPRPIWPPRPEPAPSSYTIESLEISAKLKDVTAKVQVSQTFKNTGSGQLEVCFLFPLPYDAVIDQLTLLVDGKEFPAKLLPKDEARKRFEEIVRTNRDPALLEWIGAALFQTSVFPVPPGEKRTVSLRYTQLCPRSNGLTEFTFPMSTAKHTEAPLKKLTVRVSLDSSANVKNIYSPSHEVDVDRDGKRNAMITFEAKKTIPSRDFRLFYDTGRSKVQASVISYRPDRNEDGYFLALATPEIEGKEEPATKTVVLVVDRSGSMSGEKMEQAKEGLKFVLNHLRKGDTFNVIAYDSEVESFRPELEKLNDDTRDAALGFAQGLYAGGSTNISGALERALGMLNDSKRPAYVIFLTDGLPTVGETKEAVIVQQATKDNDVRARLFTFGVGYDVNSRLLDKLSRENFGRSEYVRPEEDVEDAVSDLYARIGSPVMTDVELSLDVEDAKKSDGPVATRLYPDEKFDLFSGDQLVIVGRYAASGDAKVKLSGRVAGDEQSFDFPAELVRHSDDDANAFVAKLWAARRVGAIIDEIDLKGSNDELVKELVDLATQHGILTPYTSFLADETGAAEDRPALERNVREQLSELHAVEGDFAFRQREAKAAYQYAASPAALEAGVSGLGGVAAAGDAASDGAIAASSRSSGRAAWYYDALQDKPVVSTSCITVGRKTFFRRGQRWVDASVTTKQEAAATDIERFSDEHFELIDHHGQHVAQYLAIEEPIVIRLGNQIYSW